MAPAIAYGDQGFIQLASLQESGKIDQRLKGTANSGEGGMPSVSFGPSWVGRLHAGDSVADKRSRGLCQFLRRKAFSTLCEDCSPRESDCPPQDRPGCERLHLLRRLR